MDLDIGTHGRGLNGLWVRLPAFTPGWVTAVAAEPAYGWAARDGSRGRVAQHRSGMRSPMRGGSARRRHHRRGWQAHEEVLQPDEALLVYEEGLARLAAGVER